MKFDLHALFAERSRHVPGSSIAYGGIADGSRFSSSTGPKDADHPFGAGSITKVFTAALVAQAMSRGRLGASTAIRDVLDDVGDAVGDLTVRELANHRSGLPRLPANLDASQPDPYARYGWADLRAALRVLSRGQIIEGRGLYAYSNFGYAVLGEIVARAFASTYAAALTANILTPLRMDRSLVLQADNAPAYRAVLTGRTADGVDAAPWSFDVFAAAGGLVSTVNDLLIFSACLLDDTSEVGEAGRRCLCGAESERMAWVEHGAAVRWHNGQTLGHHAMLALNVESRIASVALWDAAASLDDIVLYAVGAIDEAQRLPVETPVPCSRLQAYVGTYEGYLGPFELSIRDERLRLRGRVYGEYTLYSSGEGCFFAKLVTATYTFPIDTDELTGVMETWGPFPAKFARRVKTDDR